MSHEEKCSTCIYWQNKKCCIMGKDKEDGKCTCGFYKKNMK